MKNVMWKSISKNDWKISENWSLGPWKIKHNHCTVIDFQGVCICTQWSKIDRKCGPQSTPKPPQIDEKTMLNWVLKIRWKSYWFFYRKWSPKGTPKLRKIEAQRGKKGVKKEYDIEHGLKTSKSRLWTSQNEGKSMPQGTKIDAQINGKLLKMILASGPWTIKQL